MNDVYLVEENSFDTMSVEDESFASASTKATLDKGLYVVRIKLMPNVHPKDVKLKEGGSPEEIMEAVIKKSSYIVSEVNGKRALVVAKKDIKVNVLLDLKHELPVSQTYNQRFYLKASRDTGMSSKGADIAGNVRRYALMIQSLYAIDNGLLIADVERALSTGALTDADLREPLESESGVLAIVEIDDISETMKLSDGSERLIEKNEINSFKISAVPDDLIELLNNM
jgi:hypothetical protein